MKKEKWIVTTEDGYRREFDIKEEAILDAEIVENSIFHPIAFITKQIN